MKKPALLFAFILLLPLLLAACDNVVIPVSESKPPDGMTYEDWEAEYRKAAKSIPYRELNRNTEKYVGQKVHYTGKVAQTVEFSGKTKVLRVDVTKDEFGLWSDTIWVDVADGRAPRILEDDIVEILGEVTGRKTYTAVLGNEVTLPQIRADFVRVISEEKK